MLERILFLVAFSLVVIIHERSGMNPLNIIDKKVGQLFDPTTHHNWLKPMMLIYWEEAYRCIIRRKMQKL